MSDWAHELIKQMFTDIKSGTRFPYKLDENAFATTIIAIWWSSNRISAQF